MDFLPAELQQYVEEHTQLEPDLLHKINRETHLHVLNPRMISGHVQGRFLSMVSHMIRPKRILEIGTYTGYGTLCMAEGLAEDGLIFTIEYNEELQSRIQQYFKISEHSEKIRLMIGDALEVVPTLKEAWDMVFIDANKEHYLEYYEMILPTVKRGGFIVADNVLWSGKVLKESDQDRDTKHLQRFNDTIQKDQRVENVLLPMRDGLMVIRKK